jgi:prephenate dehydratase
MPSPKIAFLGPEGTFAHLAAQRRFGDKSSLIPAASVRDVFDYVAKDRSRLGVVPIENSSGGTIYETVDRLVDRSYQLFIQEALSINVRLALLGKNKKNIHVIYSHFAPLHHCETWLRKNFPNAELRKEASTATAVKKAAGQKGAAAIGNRDAAQRYKLNILEFPIEQDVQNVTQFFVLGHANILSNDSSRTSLVVVLPNRPGSLVDFLEPFKNEGVNLSRVISRPVVGNPETYVFLVDIAGTEREKKIKAALKKAGLVTSYIKSIGSYPVRETYES